MSKRHVLSIASRNCPQFIPIIQQIADGAVGDHQIEDDNWVLRVRQGEFISLRRERTRDISGHVSGIAYVAGTIPKRATPQAKQTNRPAKPRRLKRGASRPGSSLGDLVKNAWEDQADPHFQQTPDEFAARSGVSRGTIDIAVQSGRLKVNDSGKIEPTDEGLTLYGLTLTVLFLGVGVEILCACLGAASPLMTLIA